MSTKIFNTRLQLKYDSWKNWYDNNPTLLAGEIAIVNVPAQTDESTGEVTQKPAILFKVGDGTTDFRTLDWASGLAADVYGWAKAETKPGYKANEIAVEDNSNFFEGANVESVLAEIWTEVKSLTGGEEGAGSIASQIQTGIEQFAATLGTAAYAATTDFDEAGTGAAEAAKVLGTAADEAGTATVHGALKSAAAANTNANSRVLTTDFEAFKTNNTAAIENAAKTGTDAAADVQDNLDAYEEANDAALAAVKATADAAAVKADVDAAFEEVNDAIEALEGEAALHAKQADLEAEAATARAAEKANADAIAVLNGNDATDGSVDKKIKDAFNKFATDVTDDNVVNSYKELIDYAAEHGSEFTELVGEVDANTKAIATLNGDSTIAGSVDKKIADAIAGENLAQYETKSDASAKLIEAKGYTDTEIGEEITARNAAIATAKQEAIDAAATDATTKANAAETNAKAYTNTEINKLHTVATSGKLGDLENEGRAATADADYVIFYCGTANALTSPEVTE